MSARVIILALDEEHALASRVSVYLHPLAGWPIIWHVVRAAAAVSPAPDDIVVLHRASIAMLLPTDGAVPVIAQAVERGDETRALRDALKTTNVSVLVDGASPLVTSASIARVRDAGAASVAVLALDADAGRYVVVGGRQATLLAADDPRRPANVRHIAPAERDEMIRVADRHSLAEVATALQCRLIRAHEERGVTFMLPSTTWVDADVRIGADTVVYPGAVLEGRTEIGSECVIGPHSRLVEATIGSGVELKGWNYVTRTSIRSNAVLEPYVRRGFD